VSPPSLRSSGQASKQARTAAFLDRDGTIIHDANFVGDPAKVELLPGAAAAIKRLNDAGIPVIVVTNQSGIARGYLTEADYERVRARLDELLKAEGAHIDATYHCPHLPEISGPCECRKPGLKLYRQAAREHGIDLARSYYVGDRSRDVEPAIALGGVGIRVMAGREPEDRQTARADAWVTHLGDSVDVILRRTSAQDRHVKRIAVLASGGGSNLQSLLDHLDTLKGDAAARVVLVASDRESAGALRRARDRGIEAVILSPSTSLRVNSAKDLVSSPDLLSLLERQRIDMVVLAGYLKMVPRDVVDRYADGIVNVHPSLLPKFGGAGMYGMRVHQAVIDAKERISGATVHFVTHEYDRGPILAQWPVAVLPTDDAATLAQRVLVAEHALYPRVIASLAAGHRDRFPLNPPPRYFENPPVTDNAIRSDILRAFETEGS
jgi:formyltetrahydrofolate-dependent phosphoribosylglycinamide formyltransferase